MWLIEEWEDRLNKMRNLLSLRLKLQLPSRLSNPSCSLSTPSILKPSIKVKVLASSSHGRNLKHKSPASKLLPKKREQHSPTLEDAPPPPPVKLENGHLRIVIMGAVSIGIFVLLNDQKALAFGPGGGPLLEEEFWDNVRRYALYALTVSTGAIYTILVPIFELLKSPITAILIIVILGGSFYILSQVLSAMSGVTDFSYDYNY